MTNSALYVGSVTHRRLRPVVHQLHYRLFWLLLDLDELEMLDRRLRFFSYDRRNLVSVADSDHGSGKKLPIKQQVVDHLHQAGIELEGGRIFLFAMPRILGYGFNPISIYFCHRADGTLAAMVYEVHNTFGERHSYLIPVGDGCAELVRQSCDKRFYVSPFMDMDMRYTFRLTRPGERITVSIQGGDATGPIIATGLSAKRQALTDEALLRALAGFPLMTLKVIGAIHWHALRLRLKGMLLRDRPLPPPAPLTVTEDCRTRRLEK